MRKLTLAGSGTPIEDEYRRASLALARCSRQPPPFDARNYDPRAVAEAREMWRVRMRTEHESVPALAALAGQLVEAGATLDAQGTVLRMALDELRHTEICGEVVRALGGEPCCDTLEVPRLPVWAGVCAEERALRNVIFGNALIEMVNTANLVDALDTLRDPCLREATRNLLADEVQHASFGFDYLAAWEGWLAERAEVRRSLDRFLRRAFAELERVRAGVGEKRVLTDDEAALGIVDPERRTEVLRHTVEGAIVPALEEFGLEAGAAWKARAADA
jgi:hypothetical protein